MDGMKLSKKVPKLLEMRGRSQADAARAMGADPARMSELKAEMWTPDIRQSLDLARFLGVTLDYLADDSQDDPPPGLSESEARVVALMRALNLPESVALARLAGPQVGDNIMARTDLDIRQTLGEPPRMAPRRSPATPADSPPEIAPSAAESTRPGPPPPRRKR